MIKKIILSKHLKNNNINVLMCKYDHAKSFNNKAAYSAGAGGTRLLYSYNTPVALIKSGVVYLNNNINNKLLFSNTTNRHLKEFLKQFYYNDDAAISKSDLMQLKRADFVLESEAA